MLIGPIDWALELTVSQSLPWRQKELEREDQQPENARPLQDAMSFAGKRSNFGGRPALRGDNSNTARQIEDSVNAELRELKLLPPDGTRSAKTIGDQMRIGFGGKLRRKG